VTPREQNNIMAAQHTTAAVHVGTPPPDFREWFRTNLYFHRFADIPGDDDDDRHPMIPTEEFKCGGFNWRVVLFPLGIDEQMSSISLISFSSRPASVEYGFSFKDNTGREVGGGSSHTKQFGPYVDHISEDNRNFVPNFAKRSTLLKSLVNGTLVIEFRMRHKDPTKPPTFIPENPSRCEIIQSMFMDEGSSDIVIEVDEQQAKDNAMKMVKTSPVIFHAHRFILKKCSAPLYDMYGLGNDTINHTIQITNISPTIFRYLLKYMYGRKVSENKMKIHAKEIIDMADRFGVSGLKLEVEACLVRTTTFTVENVMDHLHFADMKNCALLKEAAMDFILDNKVEVLKKVSLSDAPGGLLADVLAAVARGENIRNGNTVPSACEGDQYITMRVSELRSKAHEECLDVDGSRESLIAALKQSLEACDKDKDDTVEEDDNAVS
jgi:hypothetical protein